VAVLKLYDGESFCIVESMLFLVKMILLIKFHKFIQNKCKIHMKTTKIEGTLQFSLSIDIQTK